MKIIIDSNILFSSLLSSQNKFRDIILLSNQHTFISPYFSIIEVFKYKDKIVKHSKLDEVNLYESYYALLRNINMVNESTISDSSWKSAYDLCFDIDLKDIVFVSLAIEYNANLWTSDKKLRNGLILKGFMNFFEVNF